MKTKTLKVTFKAPIIFEYVYDIDMDELKDIGCNSIEEFYAYLLEDKDYFADSMYHQFRDDFSWYIKNNICLVSIEEEWNEWNFKLY